ncbi:ABC transporter ATP-binding protein [Convivina intestini]|uniref:ABC transporter ATP-binding protein n=1 Tax=Convivina intestini TaxID=1505726 RepID=UPI00200DC8D4|nr:ABC transporter ATP-binding protein [Convivina intestini]CAH1851182.1 Vitamin B12 import ATP-binding protein BtuD [Convivina intestini]
MLELQHINKTFGKYTAVNDLNLALKPGEVMGLIGQNGAGKTTTFRMILNFIQPNSGTITWNGHLLSPRQRQQIGFLPEERGLYQKQSIEEQILYLAQLHGMARVDAQQALKHWLDRLAVVGKPTDKVQKLSKGNAQKVQMIAALIFQPDFIILDEPFSGLDPVNTSLMMDEILRFRDQGAMIIFSSHDMNNVTKISDHLTMLKQGKTVLQGPLQAIREQFGRTNLYLEAPNFDIQSLAQLAGVKSIKNSGLGWQITLGDEAVGPEIFKLVTANGYIPAFSQQPPTLDEIFRQEVAIHE